MTLVSVSPLGLVSASSRWRKTVEGTLVASWAGQSISFTFTGSKLKLRSGTATTRKDHDNGGTHMLAVSIYEITGSVGKTPDMKTFNAIPGEDIPIWSDGEVTGMVVQITMIDWASVFELEALITNPHAVLAPFVIPSRNRILVIGDSITCGMTLAPIAGAPLLMPLGCLNAYPFVAQKVLNSKSKIGPVSIDILAYPGWPLVSPTEDEAEKGLIPRGGLESKLIKLSPYLSSNPEDDHETWTPDMSERPSIIILALGTNDDGYPAIKVERFTAALSGLVDLIKAKFSFTSSTPRIFIIPPWIDANVPYETLAKAFPTQVVPFMKEKYPETTVEFCDIVHAVKKQHTCDGIHPTVEGHEILGRALAEILESSFDT